MLFTKRDIREQDAKSLSQRFTTRFSRYLNGQPSEHILNDEQLIDIPACYELLGESNSTTPSEPTELPQIFHRVVTAYEKQTGQWLEPEQIALAAIKYDIKNQAKILQHHFSNQIEPDSILHCSNQTSFLRLALLTEALKLKQFSLAQPAPTPSQPPSCLRKLNILLDDISMPEIEASGRELRERCTTLLTENGVNPDALQDCWHLRMRYTNSQTTLQLKCMPIDMMRDVFEAQHKKQFGFITPSESILIEALEIEVKLNTPCEPGMPAENIYVQRLMAKWEAAPCKDGASWKRRNKKIASKQSLNFLKCPILKKILAIHIAKPADLAMTNFFIKNLQKEVDETAIHN